MPRARTRRRLVQVTGAALAALSGCAGVARRLRTEGEAPTTGSSPTPTPAATSTTTVPSETAADRTTTTADSGGTPTEPSTDRLDIDPPAASFADVPLPESADSHQFATMGRPEEVATARVFGSWKCPYTRNFVVEELPQVVDRYVRPGDLAIQFRAVAYRSGEPFLGPDAPRAARAGLSVWNAAPESYWSYFGFVFGNQPPERDAWATIDHLLSFAEAAGVDALEEVELALAGDTYAEDVRSTVQVAGDLGVFAVPRVEVDGQVAAPTVDMAATLDLLDGAADR